MQKLIIFGTIKSLHDLFTAFWIGGLLTTAITFMPAIKRVGGKTDFSKKTTKAYLHTLRIVAVISIVGLWVTGMLLSRQASVGLFNFSTIYSALLSIKHLIIFVMVAVAIYRGFILGRKIEQFNAQEQKLFAVLLLLNTVLGILVIFLSGIAAVIG